MKNKFELVILFLALVLAVVGIVGVATGVAEWICWYWVTPT
jgi:uncharacterized MAPEG superfamily protein